MAAAAPLHAGGGDGRAGHTRRDCRAEPDPVRGVAGVPGMAAVRTRQTAPSTALMQNARSRRTGSSPEAAQRCAAGAGLDAGAAHRSTIERAVEREPATRAT